MIDLKFSYFLILVNSFLFVTLSKGNSYPLKALVVLLVFAFIGLICTIRGEDTIQLLLFQIIGIFISSFYYFNFFKKSSYSINEIFDFYCRVVFWISIWGIIQTFIYYIQGNFDFRLKSIMSEPAHFAGICLPAFYYYLKNYKSNKYKFLVISTAIFLTVSSIGYICILIAIILMKHKIRFTKYIVSIIVAIALGLLAYTNLQQVKLRVDDTINASTKLDVSGSNLSTYALLSNLFITIKVFKESPFFGNGLGSHQISHAKYIDRLNGVEDFYNTYYEQFIDLNAADANSLFLRILSEAGTIGLFVIIFFLWKYYRNGRNDYIISRSILIYVFYKLFREGHYFSPEMYFLICIYYYNSIPKQLHSKKEQIAN